MAKAKLFNETAMNKVFDIKMSGKLFVGIDHEEDCIYLSNSFNILKVSRNTATYNLKPDGKVMSYILRADNYLQDKDGVVMFDKNNPQGCDGMPLKTIKETLVTKESREVEGQYTGFRFSDPQNNKSSLCLVQLQCKEGAYDYGALNAQMIDIFPDEVAIRNAKFYDGKLGPMKYVDEAAEIEYLQLPIRFDYVADGFGEFLKASRE